MNLAPWSKPFNSCINKIYDYEFILLAGFCQEKKTRHSANLLIGRNKPAATEPVPAGSSAGPWR